MAQLSREDVLKLARLARLAISDQEAEAFKKELETILQYVEQLADVDVTGARPTTQVTGLQNVMRDDTVRDYGVDRRELLALAPAHQDDQLKVKRMVG